MESPVVLDKPPENYTNERGFPVDEDDGSDAWSDLLVRHPDLAARLRPATWARKRRPSSQDGIDDSGDNFRSFDRFPFNNIPAEFRDHFPSEWVDFSPREEQRQQPPSPQHQTAATQTEEEPGPSQDNIQVPLPQYGLRNTVDLGQKSPADPSVVDAEDRSQRCMSAPPDNRTSNPNCNRMSGQGNQEQPTHQPQEPQSNVRHIPIFVEGRDKPVINKDVDHGTHYADPKPTYVPPPQSHVEREQYYADDGPAMDRGFPFSKSFDRPFFRQGTQPFTKQKMYPQAAFARGASPQRSQSPKPSFHDHVPRTETPSKPQQKQTPPQQAQRQTPPQQYKQAPPQRHTTPPPQPQAHQQSPPPQPAPQQQPPSANDPISRILSIQTDVLKLMTDVENFTGTKKDKQYIYLDEMLTRNLIKLDDIETDGKENIRQARKEAIKCIQKCIAVLEAKAENKGLATPQPVQDVEMQGTENEKPAETQEVVQNGDVEMKESNKEQPSVEPTPQDQPQPEIPVESKDVDTAETKVENTAAVETTNENPEVVDTRPAEIKGQETGTPLIPQDDTQSAEKKSPKKVVKKRDKSKDKKKVSKDKESKNEGTESQENKEDVNKKGDENENIVNKAEPNDECVDKIEDMLVDSKGDKKEQSMEVDGAASQ